MLAEAGDDPGAQHEITHRPAPGAARARQSCGDHAAERCAAKIGRYTGQHLACGVQHLHQLAQRRTGADGDHQFCRVVTDDATVFAGIEHLTCCLTAKQGLAVATLNT
ncbi:hypothetical protein ALO43_200166 [Pseudomonas tremae]|uniref:Uncharacterized protein n=1 Tax=Pseudomonas tremae TaxID=200454 RepID=A0AA40P0U2_9PSED|nr:hypothetical protein ALO43_200166 [Pseudomonas tremae]